MNKKPWDNWIPGVLSNKQILELGKKRYITNIPKDTKEIDCSAFDLHLSNEGYEMKEGSVKPSGARYDKFLKNKNIAEPLPKIKEQNLKKGQTYVFRLKEKLNLKGSFIHGQATAKSSIGRIDVLARLIVDGMDEYESFDPKGLEEGNGKMYLDITPITFNITIKEGVALSQLRLCYGDFKDSEIKSRELYKDVLKNSDNEDRTLSLGLKKIKITNKDTVGFSAKGETEALKVWEKGLVSPDKYFSLCKLTRDKRLLIEKNKFYILRSKERISLPGSIAVYCRAMDENIGEMRIHYAGFVHPFFGSKRKDGKKGTPLIFEVRGHNVNVSLANKEKMARLIFYKMSEMPKKRRSSDYANQELKLSKIFKDWD